MATPRSAVSINRCRHCRQEIAYRWGGKGALCGMCGCRRHFEPECILCPDLRNRTQVISPPQMSLPK